MSKAKSGVFKWSDTGAILFRGTFFFTVPLWDRRSSALVEHIALRHADFGDLGDLGGITIQFV